MSANRRVAILFASLALAGCDDPGEGAQFERARKLGDPVAIAVNRFIVINDRAPRDLRELTPNYLTEKQFRALSASAYIKIEYISEGGREFALNMYYQGPGTNECEYIADSSPPQWDCYGSY